MENNNNNNYDFVHHPSHYNRYSVEVFEMMKRIWGEEKFLLWCEMTAFKYRMRAGLKPGSSAEEDFEKEAFYLNTIKSELLERKGL